MKQGYIKSSLASAMISLFFLPVSATDYYVSANGNGNGTSAENPCKTLQEALNKATVSGDAVYVMGTLELPGDPTYVKSPDITIAGYGEGASIIASRKIFIDANIATKPLDGEKFKIRVENIEFEGSSLSEMLFDSKTNTDPYGMELRITDCNFSGFTRQIISDGISSDLTTIILERCEFKKNYPTSDPLLLPRTISFTITGCTFSDNEGDKDKRIIRTDGSAVMTIENSLFERNYAQYGGTLSTTGNSVIKITGCTFRNNGIKISDTSFVSDQGGAIQAEGNSSVTLENSIFEGNYAKNGGAILCKSTKPVKVEDCSFISNETSGGGGAIRMEGGDLSITKSRFLKNKANLGAAVSVKNDVKNTLDVSYSTMIQNQTTGNGSAIYMSKENVDSSVKLSHLTITGNLTKGGAAIRFDATTDPCLYNVTLENSILIGNVRIDDGGEVQEILDLSFQKAPQSATTNVIRNSLIERLTKDADNGGFTVIDIAASTIHLNNNKDINKYTGILADYDPQKGICPILSPASEAYGKNMGASEEVMFDVPCYAPSHIAALGNLDGIGSLFLAGGFDSGKLTTLLGKFSGERQLTSVFFYKTPDTTDDYSSISNNPNCLTYMPQAAGTWRNLIVDGVAETITLQDGHPFVCPQAFTATDISYARNFIDDDGWETIIFPFNPPAGDYILEYCSDVNIDKEEITFTEEENGRADTPYIIRFNNSLAEKYTFSASNQEIAKTENAYGTNFIGTYQNSTIAEAGSAYMLNAYGTNFVPCAKDARVLAFRAYISNAGKEARSFVIKHGGVTSTGHASVNEQSAIYTESGTIIIKAVQAEKVVVSDLCGRIVRTIHVPVGITNIEGLANGLYIVNGKKVIIN